MIRRAVALTVILLIAVQPAQAATSEYGSALADETDADVQVWGRESNNVVRRETHGQPTTLTSYQVVCSNDTSADACHRSTTLCGADETAAWRMTAPARPAPGPGDWTNTGVITCRADGNPAEPQFTAADFRRLPIPAPAVTVQPDPDAGPLLINIETNFAVDPSPVVLTTSVLGTPVRVRATPSRYVWRYGDGTTRTTTDPGGRYPDLSGAHVYTRPGTYTVRLGVTFTGEWALPGGPWQPVDGTATVAADPITLTTVEARAELVSP